MAGQTLRITEGVSWSALSHSPVVVLPPEAALDRNLPALHREAVLFGNRGQTGVVTEGPLVVMVLPGQKYPIGVIAVDAQSFVPDVLQAKVARGLDEDYMAERDDFSAEEVEWVAEVGKVLGPAVERERRKWAVQTILDAANTFGHSFESVYAVVVRVITHILPHVQFTRVVTAHGENMNISEEEEWDGTVTFSEEELEEMRVAFLRFDLDGGGSVGGEELLECLSLLGKDVTEEEVDEMIRVLDEDGSGELEWMEFIELNRGMEMAARQKKLASKPYFSQGQLEAFRKVFDNFGGGDGSIDASELGEVFMSLGKKVPPQELRDMVAKVDADGSGEIEWQEFIMLMRNLDEKLQARKKESKLKQEVELQEMREAFAKFDVDGDHTTDTRTHSLPQCTIPS